MKKKIKFKGKDFFGGGVILYHGKKLLLQKVDDKPYWEDFGGKTDREDNTIIDTAFRECEEESNKVLNKEFLESQIKLNKEKCYYMLNNNKYFVYMIYVSRKCKNYLTPELFGDIECHDKIKRKVEWVVKNEKLEIHPRIINL